MFISWMFITPSFKKSLIVEQFQGNYLKAYSIKMVYLRQWKRFLDLNQAGWKLQWSGKEKLRILCGFVQNVFGKWLAGETENCPDLKPGDASTFGRVIDLIGPNVTKLKRLLSAVCCLRFLSTWQKFSILVPFYSKLQSSWMVKIKCEWRRNYYSCSFIGCFGMYRMTENRSKNKVIWTQNFTTNFRISLTRRISFFPQRSVLKKGYDTPLSLNNTQLLNPTPFQTYR